MNTRKRTVVVALDMNDAEETSHPFNQLSPTAKIDYICERINKVYKELKKTEPDSQIIISWRENAISNGPEELAINKEEINYLKNKMQEITKRNKNLVIIAGATPVHKKAPHARLEKYLQRYQTDPFFEEFRKIEENLNQEDDLQINAHEEQLRSIKEKYPGKNVDVVYTSCYIFYGDKIHRRDKSTPFNEDQLHEHLKRPIVYRPTKSGRINPLLFSKHPVTDEEIDVGIEVCREHALDLLSTKEKIPFIHFVLSDFMYLRIAKIRSPYAVFLDSKSRPRLVFIPENLTEEQKQNPSEVVLYTSNIFKDEKVQGPFQPITSFASKIMTILDYFANELKEDAERAPLLNKLCNFFYKASTKHSDAQLCELLTTKLVKYKYDLAFGKGEDTEINPRMWMMISLLANLIEKEVDNIAKLKESEPLDFSSLKNIKG